MLREIKNASGGIATWAGKEFAIDEVYTLPTDGNLLKWVNNSELLTAIGVGSALVGNGSTFFSDVNTAINFLKGNLPAEVKIVSNLQPFADKELITGERLYKRKHGVKIDSIPANGSASAIFVIPYAACKLTDVEVIGGREDDEVDFFILDTVLGTVSGIPNFPLNQFGYDVQIIKDKHLEHSDYDADMFAGLQVMFQYYNNNNSPVKPKFNLTVHEVKS